MNAKDVVPKVSVCIVTYNHEKFIEQCLQSLVEQETDFPFEVIVGDDCSSDGTRAIVQNFADRYPHLVRAIMQPMNLGPTRNYLAVHASARGRYIAQLDGDDYALPGKLQAQADCLDNNPNVSFCAHAVTLIGAKENAANSQYPEYGSIEDLLKLGTYFVASSVCYRKDCEYPHSHLGAPGVPEVVDYYLHLERASKGKIYFDRRLLGCYRVHPQGMSRNPLYQQLMEDAYQTAFDRALELGAPVELVAKARLRKRMVFSIARFLAGDVKGYKRTIKISRADWRLASIKHILLHLTRFFPDMVRVYARMRGMT